MLHTYRRIVCLQWAQQCGMCGSKRHATKPFWHLGKRICRYCLQANLISNVALEERYWLSIWGPSTPSHKEPAFVDRVIGRVWYFKEYGTARQRTEYSCDSVDFQTPYNSKKSFETWFFWRPHLEEIFDFKKLETEAALKNRAAATVNGLVRRALTLRILNSIADKKRPTRMVEWGKKEDKRTALFKLRRMAIVETSVRNSMVTKPCNQERRRILMQFEDRLTLLHQSNPRLELAAPARDNESGIYGLSGP